ncbi:MAG TPA: hypothetical protein VMU14_08845 [Acidimicrobiales bacterium]|nr:hypothetical protein [Acidimicrobiales bacterium]
MASVVNTFFAQVKPGGLEQAIELSRRVAKPLERSGAKNVRLLRSATGETYGALVLVMEYASMKDYGVSYDKIMKDDEVIELIAKSDSASSPFLAQSISVSTEVPIGTTPSRGPVVLVATSRPQPGRLEDAVELGAKVGKAFAKLGAGARLFQSGISGTQSGTFAFSVEFPSMAKLGEVTDAILESKDGQEMIEDLNSSKSPIVPVSTDIYTEITL